MAEKFYRLPIANSVIKLSSIEYITPIVAYEMSGRHAFRVVYNNYTTIPSRFVQAQSNNATSNTAPAAGFLPTSQVENGFNATVFSDDLAQLTTIREDLINTLTDNGVNLINNFPDL